MARIDYGLATAINGNMVDFLLEKYERYYLFAYSIVKNQEQTKRIMAKAIYFSLYNGRKLKKMPKLTTWFYQLVIKDGMRKMHELDRYKRDFTYDSQIYAFMETIEPSAVNAFKLYYFEELSISETGEILRLKQGEVEKRLKYVRKELGIDSSLEDESGEKLQELIDVYESPEIPEDLETLIYDTIEREKQNFEKFMRKQTRDRWLKPMILLACLALWFFGTIALAEGNAGFRELVTGIPVVRHLFIPFI
ncbi:MAG: sigma-70 family RNA polymerase sigma factor [Clostridiales bacterium]|nr:sigma-70 family RNA polymerase sigma factor [Clostridiales bacterium]